MGRRPPTTGLTYDDLQRFPDDGLRREIIDGVLYVTPSPVTRHQLTVVQLSHDLYDYAETHGGVVLVAPFDVKFTERDVVEPDVLFVCDADRLGERFLDSPPDLEVEISSPGTVRVDRIKKRALYEREGVPEYWIIDLDHDEIEAYVLRDGRYGDPHRFRPCDTVTATPLAGFAADFNAVVAQLRGGSSPPR